MARYALLFFCFLDRIAEAKRLCLFAQVLARGRDPMLGALQRGAGQVGSLSGEIRLVYIDFAFNIICSLYSASDFI